ncbi:Hypothetical predicted protein [Cloeon dipterum]|uniref:Uncharacterized protein n=1 Tax=Cloeon dipterum TaxID=197152 RepID=A0A8S1CI39_9INSE|nr:Hypothetical predicted protein [Cloeon dipterum]
MASALWLVLALWSFIFMASARPATNETSKAKSTNNSTKTTADKEEARFLYGYYGGLYNNGNYLFNNNINNAFGNRTLQLNVLPLGSVLYGWLTGAYPYILGK